MKITFARFTISGTATLLIAGLMTGCVHRESAAFPAASPGVLVGRNGGFAEKIHLTGTVDVGKLNDHLYRGAQPNVDTIQHLKKLGVTTIVDLRGERQGTVRREREQAAAVGIKLENIRASGWSPPKDELMAQFFSVLRKRPRETIYVHCWLGDDRTGVFLAAYRIAFEHWSAERALQEMNFFHFKRHWHPAMIHYIRAFPARYATAPAFAPFREEDGKTLPH
jgi:tyrosine-protein phosphatase SIW14